MFVENILNMLLKSFSSKFQLCGHCTIHHSCESEGHVSWEKYSGDPWAAQEVMTKECSK